MSARMSGPADICMMYSVTDVQGLNSISRRVLGNAAHALAGMMRHAIPPASEPARPALGLTMFGVTTPCVQMVAKALEADYDCLVFHATGTGGQSMEKLVDSGLVRRRDRRHHDRGVRPFDGRRVQRGRGPARRDRPHGRALCRLLRRARHGELRRDGERARALSRPEPLRAQPAGHADAHDARGERAHGRLDRGAAEPDAGAGALLPAGGRRLATRCAGPAVPRSQGGCGAVRDPRGEGDAERQPEARCACRATSTTRRSRPPSSPPSARSRLSARAHKVPPVIAGLDPAIQRPGCPDHPQVPDRARCYER